MPEQPEPKIKPQVSLKDLKDLKGRSTGAGSSSFRTGQASIPSYVELAVTTNFSFLTGASHPEELVQAAAMLGYGAMGIADRHTVAGIVRAHVAAKEAGIALVVGTRIELQVAACKVASSLLLFPSSRPAYSALCRLLTLGKRRAPKGECHLDLHDVMEAAAGEGGDELSCVVTPPMQSGGGWPAPLDEEFIEFVRGLKSVLCHRGDDRLSIAAARLYGPDDDERLDQLANLAEHVGVPLVATNDVHYHTPQRAPLQDVLTCIRHGCTIRDAGLRLFASAERHLKHPAEMARLFARYPEALARSVEIAGRATGEVAKWQSGRVAQGPDSGAKRASVSLCHSATSGFTLDQIRYEYPDEVIPSSTTAMQHLTELTWQGARGRYPGGVPPKVSSHILHELKLIDELKYAHYFLTVHDIVLFARSQGILCQGRGAAANSAVCFCLGITSVDPDRIDVLFERFVSKERNEPPDIDIDFEHERREEVIQYLYRKYGRERAALTAEVISYRPRSALRDVGKALGLSLDAVDALAKNMDWWESRLWGGPKEEAAEGQNGETGKEQDASGQNEREEMAAPSMSPTAAARLCELGLNPDDPTIFRLAWLAQEILGFPRHLSQHVGGFVITKSKLCDLVPIENAAMEDRTVIEWDKDDIDAMGMMKVDCLGLGMLTCIQKCFALLEKWQSGKVPEWQRAEEGRGDEHQLESPGEAREKNGSEGLVPPRGSLECDAATGGLRRRLFGGAPLGQSKPLALHTIPADDPVVYDMICKADTIGVFQIESRAQMSMLPRLRPRCFYDLVIEVAIVRPGPIQGNMVHPYLRRRNGEEPEEYPKEELRAVLGKTKGVPLFQEQAMQLAIVAAGFTPGESDKLRRAMAAWKRKGDALLKFEDRFIGGMVKNGYPLEFAQRCFEQLKGFSEYGFPESHAASFALLVYVSSWLKCHHPAHFAAALLNSQPMGFYAPAQIVRDAQQHGVPARPVDVNLSGWDCEVERVGEGQSGPAAECPTRDASRLAAVPLGHAAITHPALRLGMRLVSGLAEAQARLIEKAVSERGPFRNIPALWRASGVKVTTLRRLAEADGFGSMGLDRQRALWEVAALRDERLPMFEQEEERDLPQSSQRGTENQGEQRKDSEVQDGHKLGAVSCPFPFSSSSSSIHSPALPSLCGSVSPVVQSAADSESGEPSLPPIAPLRKVLADYASMGLSLKAHPVSFIRERLTKLNVTPCGALRDEREWSNRKRVAVAGVTLVRQRPGTAKGIVFMTIEDETAAANLIIRPSVFERYRNAARHGVVVIARGVVERQGDVVHVMVRSIHDAAPMLSGLDTKSRDFH